MSLLPHRIVPAGLAAALCLGLFVAVADAQYYPLAGGNSPDVVLGGQNPYPGAAYPPPGQPATGQMWTAAQPAPGYGQRGPAAGEPPGTWGPPGVVPRAQVYPPSPVWNDPTPAIPGANYDVFPVVPETAPLDQDRYIDIDALVEETETGRLMLGVGVNSEAGVTGSLIIDEQNFDIHRWPASFHEIIDGTAFRGAGQRLRIEVVPGNQVQRYTVSFQEPYLFDTPVSYGLSAYYYTRFYREWDEQRLGGRTSLGYQFTPDLSGTVFFRGESVEIFNPIEPTPPEIQRVLGDNALYAIGTRLAHDTRDSAFLATEGHLLELSFEQVFGTFSYPRFTADARRYFMLRERPDRSGRHTLALAGHVGISGEDTPVYENFFIGGFSTLRGFEFRGASPRTLGAVVGGRFMLLGSVEYLFPITADDMLRGIVFTDFGTVERDVEIDLDNFRVAPGFGLRITVPALGPAPIALDLAFPVTHADGDEIQNFSFFVGYFR